MPIQVIVPHQLLQVAEIGPETLKLDWGLPVACAGWHVALQSQPLLLSDILLTGLFPLSWHSAQHLLPLGSLLGTKEVTPPAARREALPVCSWTNREASEEADGRRNAHFLV